MGQSQCYQVYGDKKASVLAVAKSGQVDDKVLGCVASVGLFSYLEFHEHELIAKCMNEKDFADKEEVVHEGDAGHEMYIIQSGKAVVTVNSQQVAKLSAGDYFGEQTLLWDQPRTATVSAKGALKCLELTRERFEALELKSALHFPKRACLSSGESKPSSGRKNKKGKKNAGNPEEQTLTEEEVSFIADALSKNPKLMDAMDLQRENLEAMAGYCKEQKFSSGDIIIKQGDKVAEEMYIIKSGSATVSIAEGGKKGSVTIAATLTEGQSFGELALIHDAARAATVLVASDLVAYSLHRSAFKLSMRSVADKKSQDVAKFLATVPCLSALSGEERKALSEAIMVIEYAPNEEIIRKKDDSREFMILAKGSVVPCDVKKDDDAAPTYDKAGSLVACDEFIVQSPHKYTMQSGDDGATIYLLDRVDFKTYLSGVEHAIREKVGHPDAPKKKKATFATSVDDATSLLRYPEAEFKNLRKVRIIGTGGFGTVYLVQQAGGGCCSVGRGGAEMAMKVVSKGLIERDRVQAGVCNERKIMSVMSDNPFIVHLYGTYKDSKNIYLLMEACMMDFLAAYSMHKLFGKDEVVRYHIAILTLALEALHVRRIVYRDVKPENLLIDTGGKVRLCDFGISKLCPGLTYSVVGTPEYCAPEVFSGQGYRMSCDWWAVGVLIFELMTGGNPFNKGNDILGTMQAVKKGFSGSKKNDNIPFQLERQHPQAVELLKAVCQKKPKSRLPVGKTGQDNVEAFKTHAWFQDLDWAGIAANKEDGPAPAFIPPANRKPLKEPHPEDLPEEVEYSKESCDWDGDF